MFVFSEFGANNVIIIPAFFYSVWIKSRRKKRFTFSFFLIRSELLDVLLISNIQKCLPADQPRNSNAVIPLQTSGWWSPRFIQIILFFKYSEQLNCSWNKKVGMLAGRFLISKGRKWHWEVLVWVYALFENKTLFFWKENWKAFTWIAVCNSKWLPSLSVLVKLLVQEGFRKEFPWRGTNVVNAN